MMTLEHGHSVARSQNDIDSLAVLRAKEVGFIDALDEVLEFIPEEIEPMEPADDD